MSKYSLSPESRSALIAYWAASGFALEGTGGNCEAISGSVGDKFVMITAKMDPSIPDSIDDIHEVSIHMNANAEEGNFEEGLVSFFAMNAESASSQINYFLAQPDIAAIKLKDFFVAQGMSYEYPGFLEIRNDYGILTIGKEGESFSEDDLLNDPVSVQIMSPDSASFLMGSDALCGGYALAIMELWKSGKVIEAIGDDFAGILKDWAEGDDFEEMKAANADEPDRRICHSHDFCDANMAMLEAMQNFGFKEEELLDDIEGMSGIWNAAWNYAAVKHLGRPA